MCLPPPPPEEPPESVPVVTLPGSPLKLLLNEVAVLGSFPLKFLFPFLPSWSRSKWWTVFIAPCIPSVMPGPT